MTRTGPGSLLFGRSLAALAAILLAGGCTPAPPPLAERGAEQVASIEPSEAPDGSVAWTQWRGPTFDGATVEDGLVSRPGLRLTARWEREVGTGYSGITIDRGRIFTVGYSGGEDTLYCLSADTGEIGWQFSYAANDYDSQNAGGPSATPSCAGGLVTTISRDGLVYCLAVEDGALEWAVDLAAKLGVSVPKWGFSGSPIVDGGELLIDLGVIAALDRETGEVRWKTKDYGPAYSSPVPFDLDGKRYVAAFPKHGLVVLDRATGAEQASYFWSTSYGVNAATPLVLGDRIFISSGYNSGCALLRFTGSELEEVWKNKNLRAHMASPVAWEGHIYGLDEARLVCLDAATGKRRWSQGGIGKGALMRAGGTLVVQGASGELQVGPASPEAFEPTAKLEVFSASGCWTAPTLSGGRIFCRSPDGTVVCVDMAEAE